MSMCRLDNPIKGAILIKTFIFPPVFLYTSEMQSSKFSLQATLTPSSFSHALFSISYPPTRTVTFSLLLNSECHFSQLILKRLLSSYWNKALQVSPNDLIRPSILSAVIYGVLSSTSFAIPISSMIKKRSVKKI